MYLMTKMHQTTLNWHSHPYPKSTCVLD